VQTVVQIGELIDTESMEVLSRALDCDDDESLEEALSKIGRAAMGEYVEMLLGKSLPTRATEMQERRLYHLSKQYFGGRIPTEAEIATMFQLTETASRTLLRHVKTKYKFELEQQILATVRATLSTAERSGTAYRVVIQSDAILQELRRIVSIEGPRLDQVSKVRNSAGLYDIPLDTFHLLLRHYGLTLAEVEAAADSEA
jgi:hypothetical protein